MLYYGHIWKKTPQNNKSRFLLKLFIRLRHEILNILLEICRWVWNSKFRNNFAFFLDMSVWYIFESCSFGIRSLVSNLFLFYSQWIFSENSCSQGKSGELKSPCFTKMFLTRHQILWYIWTILNQYLTRVTHVVSEPIPISNNCLATFYVLSMVKLGYRLCWKKGQL